MALDQEQMINKCIIKSMYQISEQSLFVEIFQVQNHRLMLPSVNVYVVIFNPTNGSLNKMLLDCKMCLFDK